MAVSPEDPAATVPPVTTATPKRYASTTHLYALKRESVRLESFAATGGAIESMGDNLLVVTPKGRFALVFPDGTAEYLDGNVPMNETSLEEYEDYDNPGFKPDRFRTADILLKELGEGRYELFATHHYFTGECIRFRLSSTTILRDEESVTVLPDWRTIFDAEPCLPLLWFGGHQAGGKMLTDGAGHLLVTIGDHLLDDWRARPTFEPDIHLGKLVRIAIETGEVETLAIGFRNSQGLVRDAEGNLWVPDHGAEGGDELNLLERGGNYGWPLVSYGVEYGGEVPPTMEDKEVGRHDGFVRPVFSWVPSPAVSAIAVNDERRFPLWKDDLLVASLAAQALFRVRRHGTDVQYVERIELGYRIRDITFMPDGRIALLSDGALVNFLSRSPMYCDEEARNRRDVYSVNCEAIVERYRETWRTATAGKPTISAYFDVHLKENTLTYVKEPCALADTKAKFSLHLIPADVNDLPDYRQQYGFDNLDFDFDQNGAIFGRRCMTTVALPEYDIAHIRTGQGDVWSGAAAPSDKGDPGIDTAAAPSDKGDPGIDTAAAPSDKGDPGIDIAAAPSDKGDPGMDTAAGKQLFDLHCSACHYLNVERHDAGPHLVGIIGRRASEVGGYRFSDAFDLLDVVWTRNSITRFLTDPQQFAPGTSMMPSGIDEAEARVIADYIISLNYHPERPVGDR